MFVKGVGVTGFNFLLVNASDGTALTGATVTCKVSKDGGAQATSTNSATELAGGEYTINLTATEMTATTVGLLFTAASAIPVHFTIPTVAMNLDANSGAPVTSGTAADQLSVSSGKVTVGTNDDKTGYSLTQTFPANFGDLGITAAGKISEVVLTDALTGYTAPPSAAVISAQVASDLAAAHGAGSWATATGFAVPGDAMAITVGSGSALVAATAAQITTDHGSGSYLRNTEPDNAGIAAIQAKTDNLPADPAGLAGLASAHGASSWATATGFAVPGDAMTLTSAGLDSVLVESGISVSAALVNDSGSQLTGINAKQAIALILSSTGAVLSGAPTTNISTAPAGKPSGPSRLDVTVDSSNNRTAVNMRVPD